jgi:hypothetical protein
MREGNTVGQRLVRRSRGDAKEGDRHVELVFVNALLVEPLAMRTASA